jgi:hypothetical protein
VVTAPIVFSSAECMEHSMRGEVILCLHECFPIDARALRAATGVITMGGSIFRCVCARVILTLCELNLVS